MSQSDLDRVYNYIENQEQHHRRMSFQDEFRSFLRKYEIDYNEKSGTSLRTLSEFGNSSRAVVPRALPWAGIRERLRR